MDTSLNIIYGSGSLISSQAYFYFTHKNTNYHKDILFFTINVNFLVLSNISYLEIFIEIWN